MSYRPQFIVTLQVPFTIGDACQSAIDRQCDNMSGQGHSVDGDIDCYPETEWTGKDCLFTTITVKTSKDLTADDAMGEAVTWWNFFLPLWTARWFSAACGEPAILASTPIL
jgi:hypothetical protein